MGGVLKQMRIYMDNCCYNRPYDDMRYDMVRMEAEAVILIIDMCEKNGWELYTSDVLLDEINNIPNLFRKQKVLQLYHSATNHIELSGEILERGKDLERFHIRPYDALHLASAESVDVDVFLTTDRKLINLANRSNVRINVKNPLVWLTEVLYDEC